MLPLPNNRFSNLGDLNRLADWAELCCLTRDPPELSDGDIADQLHGSLLLDDRNAGAGESRQEHAERVASAVIVVLERRLRALGTAYPFDVASTGVRVRQPWYEALCYTSLLAADVGRFYVGTRALTAKDEKFTKLFEKVVEASMRAIFSSTAVRFGWPIEDEWPKPVEDRLSRLAAEFEVETLDVTKHSETKDKDIGLDVAVRLRFGDQGPGTGVILIQCATGEDWSGKYAEPALPQWDKLIHWKSHLIQGIAFPWRNDHDLHFRQLVRKFPGIVFDRMRLMSGPQADEQLDAHCYPALEEWCVNRLSELPI